MESAGSRAAVERASISALNGAGVPPSPKTSVVTPWVTFPTTRESPRRNAPVEPLWMSMNPGETTIPVASIR